MFGFAKAFACWAFGFQAATCCGTAQSCAGYGYITRLTLKPADPSSASLHISLSLSVSLSWCIWQLSPVCIHLTFMNISVTIIHYNNIIYIIIYIFNIIYIYTCVITRFSVCGLPIYAVCATIEADCPIFRLASCLNRGRCQEPQISSFSVVEQPPPGQLALVLDYASKSSSASVVYKIIYTHRYIDYLNIIYIYTEYIYILNIYIYINPVSTGFPLDCLG
jgi:hypothetical protein